MEPYAITPRAITEKNDLRRFMAPTSSYFSASREHNTMIALCESDVKNFLPSVGLSRFFHASGGFEFLCSA
jgi:hypothetical protein